MVRVRFAPSPTGHLHIGGARTALFNWLFARHNKGVFILRIEDTDRSRSTEEFIEAIIEGMRWLGLDWDEGPYRQTDRLDIYKSYAERLLKDGNAYYCYCSPEELEERRRLALASGRPPKYDGRCRDLKTPVPGRLPAIRFRMPQSGITVVEDLIRGKVTFDNEQLDDFIIMRSDGTPTYNFCVVVDDVDMRITHVIRGDDHLNNTPKQIHIYKALKYDIPQFAHLPMILGPDKTRLSKRHGATSVMAYRDMGYLPEALLNYLVRLGWSYKDQEIFSREELIEKFTLENVGKSPAVFNPEKLLWLNSHYISTSTNERLYELVRPFLIREGIIREDTPIDIQWISRAIATLKERSRTLVELTSSLRYYILEDIEIEEDAKKKFINEKTIEYLKKAKELLGNVEPFTSKNLEEAFKKFTIELGVKLSDVAQPLRVAITGKTVSPPIFDVLEVMGKEKVLRRLEKALAF
ncbi:MAG: glutamate--tRNA ligase [Thermodesulfovibrionales bacterium]|nr:glutamate--tRNA ligase [Thermodesulfovibrionales bacterium]